MGLFPTPGLFGSQQRQTLTQAQDKIQAVFIGGLRSSTGEAALGTKAPQVGERVEAGEQGPRGGGGVELGEAGEGTVDNLHPQRARVSLACQVPTPGPDC